MCSVRAEAESCAEVAGSVSEQVLEYFGYDEHGGPPTTPIGACRLSLLAAMFSPAQVTTFARTLTRRVRVVVLVFLLALRCHRGGIFRLVIAIVI